MGFLHTFLRSLNLFVIVFSILIGIFAGWGISELLVKKYRKMKINHSTIICFRLGTALVGGLSFSIFTYCLLSILP